MLMIQHDWVTQKHYYLFSFVGTDFTNWFVNCCLMFLRIYFYIIGDFIFKKSTTSSERLNSLPISSGFKLRLAVSSPPLHTSIVLWDFPTASSIFNARPISNSAYNHVITGNIVGCVTLAFAGPVLVLIS